MSYQVVTITSKAGRLPIMQELLRVRDQFADLALRYPDQLNVSREDNNMVVFCSIDDAESSVIPYCNQLGYNVRKVESRAEFLNRCITA